MRPGDSMGWRLRVAGIIVTIGLLVEALCLVWSKPIAFVVLVCVGGALIGLGVLLFLYSLLSVPPNPSGSSGVAEDNH
jgi:RsiW-degrading membrane proteinase PrsW (M82 family)